MNKQAADLIAQALRDGFFHPGNPELNQPAVPLATPFGVAGNPHLKREVDAVVQLWAEGLVHHLEINQQTILDTSEAEQLRRDAQPADENPIGVVTVHCMCDRNRAEPLLHLVIKDKTAVIDGSALTPCPHGKH